MFKAEDIRQLLKNNVVEVVFTKKDGSERTMFATLIDDFLPSLGEEIATSSEHDDNLITCWDLEHDAWRSFRVDSVKSVEAEPVD